MSLTKWNDSNMNADVSKSSVILADQSISDQVCRIYQFLVFAAACQVVDLFGLGTNVINIVCFIKIGFKDSVNISLLGLAVSDLLGLAMLIFLNICYNPYFQDLDLPFEPLEVQYLLTGWPRVVFTKITGWITALITVERCLCVTTPLKVKAFLTPKRVTCIVVGVFLLFIVCGSPIYFVNGLGWKFSYHKNRTVLGLVFTADRERIEKAVFTVVNVLLGFSEFLVVSVATTVLVVKLRSKTKWRKKSVVSVKVQTTVSRDEKVSKMIVLISIMFIISFLPVCVTFLVMVFIPDMAVDGKDRNLLTVVGGVQILTEAMNSASNIFIYYHMSSNFRAVFCQLFNLHEKLLESNR